MKSRSLYLLGPVAVFALALGACSKKSGSDTTTTPAATPPEPPASTAPAESTAPPAAETPTREAAPEGAKISFVGIKDGDTVSNPVKFTFGIEGAKIAPAGTMEPGTGHFHVIVDSDLPPQDAPLPATDKIIHFGKGQTEAELTLDPGPHTLQLEFTDGKHMPFDPPVVSDKINITVK